MISIFFGYMFDIFTNNIDGYFLWELSNIDILWISVRYFYEKYRSIFSVRNIDIFCISVRYFYEKYPWIFFRYPIDISWIFFRYLMDITSIFHIDIFFHILWIFFFDIDIRYFFLDIMPKYRYYIRYFVDISWISYRYNIGYQIDINYYGDI